MSVRHRAFALVLLAALLVSGCGSAAPAATPVPPTATEVALAATDAPQTPTASPPPPAATAVPPSATPDVVPFEVTRDLPYIAGGHSQQMLDLYLPAGGDGPFPTLLMLHGGGEDKADLVHWARHFVERGYAAIPLNYRDITLFDYPASVQDAFCALAWTHINADTYDLDPARIVVLGHSAGGTLTAMLGTVDDPKLFTEGCPHQLPQANWLQGVVPFTGIFDYESALQFRPERASRFQDFLGGTPDQIPETWAEASAATWVDGSESPFLLIHGTKDGTIEVEQSLAFAETLEQAGVDAELLLIPDADHGAIIDSEQAFEAVEEFLVTLAQAPPATPVPAAEAAPQPTTAPTTRPGYFSRDELIADARQLAHSLESAHPDPYSHGGGRIAFHRRLQRLLNAIPPEGMTRDEFLRLLRPFVAAVGDSHTEIWGDYRVNDSRPGGVPFRFRVVEGSLYVAGVPHASQEISPDLIGATLVSVEGVPLAELCERQTRLQGTENEYNTLLFLAMFSLRYRPFMQDLLPEWQDTGEVRVELQLPGGEIEEYLFALPVRMSTLTRPRSRVRLPAPDRAGFRYDFLDAEGKTAYLTIEHMSRYREAYEIWATAGSVDTVEATRAHIKSATETFRSLVVDMKEVGTETLIVDLRHDEGGNSLMSDILLYFLYDRQDFLAALTHTPAAGGGEIRRYSRLYFENCPNQSIDDFNQGRAVPLLEGDYNFDADFTGDVERFQEQMQQSETPAFLDEWYQMAPTFYTEYQSGDYAGYYRPENVLVLVTPETFSSGFTMAEHLYLAGATLVGTPSAQAADCFGETLTWQLDHTGIEGSVSGTYYNTFPDDPEVGRVLPVHYPLTYEKLVAYEFDPDAEYLYALELLPELGGQ